MQGVKLDQLRLGNRRALAKAITLVESKLEKHRAEAQTLLEQLLPDCGKSLRIGISGTPGVGKSTFIEAFGKCVIDKGKKVAVLAVDPSSPVAGGSILGDKTRMERLSRDANAFIRPSPSSGHLGGVAQKTRESMLLCEAAGFDIIIVETVGVGQSEFDVAGMVDFFLVLMQPNAGDELQGIKKGILELADAVLVNKADGEGKLAAEKACRQYQAAMTMVGQREFWSPRIMTCSAQENSGIEETWQMLSDYQAESSAANYFDHKRAEQNKAWMQTLFAELVELKMQRTPEYAVLKKDLENEVIAGRITPLSAAKKMLTLL